MATPTPPVFHRHGGDYLPASEWGPLLRADERVSRALGPEPLSDARHLLPPLPVPASQDNEESSKPRGADLIVPGADFVVDLRPDRPRTVAETYPLFSPAVRAELDFPRVYVALPGRDGRSERLASIDEAPDATRVGGVVLAWSLPDLVSIGDARAAAGDLRRFVAEAARIGLAGGFTAAAREDAGATANRATALRSVLHRFGGRVEMRLLAAGAPFPSRSIWRALYSLGLTWGSMDLFHWTGGTETSQFRVLSSGTPAYFLPERAAEGERVPGLILEFDLPRAHEPVALFDRMAVALASLRGTIGGRAVTRTGADLDGDQLDFERDALGQALRAMTAAGIAPGSAAALRYF